MDIPQNPMFVIRNKADGKFMNASSGATGNGPASLFKDLKSIKAFIEFYQGADYPKPYTSKYGPVVDGVRQEIVFDFEVLPVEVKLVGEAVGFEEIEEIVKKNKIKKKK